MTAAVGVANIVMGLVYLMYGTMTIFDLRDGWHDKIRRQFGFAFLAIMFTCGPHHFEHGMHLLLVDGAGGPIDLLTIVVGLPPGLAWFLLRIEAMLGGRGDRLIQGSPKWLVAIPLGMGVYTLGLISYAATEFANTSVSPRVIPNLIITVLYLAIGSVLVSTQLRNRRLTGAWSLSGAGLAGVFLTCSPMHLVYAAYGSAGRYRLDSHILAIDLIMIPGAALFLAFVWRVHGGSVRHEASAKERETVRVG